MLTYHQWGPLAFIRGQFHKRHLSHDSLKKINHLKSHSNLPEANELTCCQYLEKHVSSIQNHMHIASVQKMCIFLCLDNCQNYIFIFYVGAILWTIFGNFLYHFFFFNFERNRWNTCCGYEPMAWKHWAQSNAFRRYGRLKHGSLGFVWKVYCFIYG